MNIFDTVQYRKLLAGSMLTSFLSVGQQVVILFILISVGFITAKKKVFTKESIANLATFILYVVTPCVIIESFNRPFDSSMLTSLFIAFACAAFVHLLTICIVTFLIKDPEQARKRVLQFGVVFSNCGYMALPLQSALLGSDGVFFGAAFIAVFNLVVWTYGIRLMDDSGKASSIKEMFLNPGVISVAIGLFLFLTPFDLPQIIFTPVKLLAALNTPLPMVVVGYYLSGITSLAFLKDKKLLWSLSLRLIIVPLVSLALLYAVGIRGVLLTAMIIAAASPTGVNTVMFAVKFNKDPQLGVTMVSVSTLLSIITMPLIVGFTIYLSGV